MNNKYEEVKNEKTPIIHNESNFSFSEKRKSCLKNNNKNFDEDSNNLIKPISKNSSLRIEFKLEEEIKKDISKDCLNYNRKSKLSKEMALEKNLMFSRFNEPKKIINSCVISKKRISNNYNFYPVSNFDNICIKRSKTIKINDDIKLVQSLILTKLESKNNKGISEVLNKFSLLD